MQIMSVFSIALVSFNKERMLFIFKAVHSLFFDLTSQAFWKQRGFSGEIVARPSENCPLSVTFDATSPRGSPALVGFITGVQARDWCDRKVRDRQREGVWERE